MNITLKLINDSTYNYFDKVEIEVPDNLKIIFNQIVEGKTSKLGLLIYAAGGGSQGTLGGLLEQANDLPALLKRGANPKVQQKPGLFLAANQVERLDIPQTTDRSQGDVHSEGNPHVMTDPRRVLQVAEQLSQRLIQLDPKNEAYYQARFETFKQRWSEATNRWDQLKAPLKGKAVVVHHQSWVYQLDWLGMTQLASLEPLPGVPPSTRHLSQLKQQVNPQTAYAIIRSPFADKKASQWLSKQSGVCAIKLPFTVGGNDEAKDLFSLFDSTINLLLNASNCKQGE
jgi:zinc/manganese transport system substrate-binding protein